MATALAAALVLAADQLTKLWVRSAFLEEEVAVVVRGFLNLTYVRNRGGAFGIFPHQQALFIVLSFRGPSPSSSGSTEASGRTTASAKSPSG